MRISSSCLILLLLTAGCVTHRPRGQDGGQVVHVVVCWLKQPGDAGDRRKLIDATRSFAAIPGVIDLHAGGPMPRAVTRPIDDVSFDLAITMTFRDQKALADYQTHPAHQAAVRDVLRPLTNRVVVYDFIDVLRLSAPDGKCCNRDSR